jgi:dihydrofolate reductase
MSRVALVVAAAKNGVIGRDGALPWRIPSDLKRFKSVTMGKPIIMGRKTWDSLPKKPLPGRLNIVLTRQAGFTAAGAVVAPDREAALLAAGDADEICVIGGGEIYESFLPIASRIYLSEVDAMVEGDTYFPPLDNRLWAEVASERQEAQEGDSARYAWRVLERRS